MFVSVEIQRGWHGWQSPNGRRASDGVTAADGPPHPKLLPVGALPILSS
jgi:hypothetical protein